jgi:short-subunit dehydrogenase
MTDHRYLLLAAHLKANRDQRELEFIVAHACVGSGQTALITGASSGIGEALAERFARAGFNLVLVARSADKLRTVAQALSAAHGVKVLAAPADLSRPDAAQKLGTAMRRARRSIDVLVNNAGVLEHGSFAGMPARRHRELIELNVTGLTEMLAQFIPGMVARGRGRVLNVASIAAFQPVPTLATYAATKAYVLSLTESLSEELDGTGVTVTALCPGITATPMLSRARKASRELGKLPRIAVSDVVEVADEGFEACMNGEVIRVPGVLNLAATLVGRATPKWLLRRVSGAVARGMRR